MKRFLLFIPLMVLFSFTTNTGFSISKKERRQAAQTLLNTRDALVASVSNLSEAQWNFKPAPDRWSIKECVQHLALAEAALWQMCDGMVKQAANPEKRSEIKVSDEQVIQLMEDRSNKKKTTDMLQPDKATWSTPGEALKAFTTQRDKLIIYIQSTQDDLRSHVAETPLGLLDAYQLVLLIAAHSNRHTQQINEVKTAERYPL